MHAGKSLNKSFSWIWPAGDGVATWSIFVECETGLGAGGDCEMGRRKGAVDPRLLHHASDFGQGHLCLGLHGCYVGSGDRLGEMKRYQNDEYRIQPFYCQDITCGTHCRRENRCLYSSVGISRVMTKLLCVSHQSNLFHKWDSLSF